MTEFETSVFMQLGARSNAIEGAIEVLQVVIRSVTVLDKNESLFGEIGLMYRVIEDLKKVQRELRHMQKSQPLPAPVTMELAHLKSRRIFHTALRHNVEVQLRDPVVATEEMPCVTPS
jgi:hypothetical protein